MLPAYWKYLLVEDYFLFDLSFHGMTIFYFMFHPLIFIVKIIELSLQFREVMFQLFCTSMDCL